MVSATLLTRMKCGAKELAQERVRPTTPCLAAVYANMPAASIGAPVKPPVELVSTIAPPLQEATIEGMAARPVFHTPVRFTPMTSVHCCSEDAIPPGPIPAFAITI